MNIRNLSIKRKLTLITVLTSTLALVLASAGFAVFELVAARREMTEDLMTQAQVMGSNGTAAIAFRDANTSREILRALQAREGIVAAAFYTQDDRLFSYYLREGRSYTPVPLRPDQAGYRSNRNHLRVFREISLQGRKIGTVYLESDMQQWHERVVRYTGLIAVLMFGSAVFALLVSSRLQRVISEPILGLEKTMRTVSAQKNFSLRAVKSQEDEIGGLIDGFNTMLAEIQARDAALQGANHNLTFRTRELEREAAERLKAQEELKTLNATLERRVAERTRILQSVLDSMSDGVIVADEEGRFTLVNPAAEEMLHLHTNDVPDEKWAMRHGVYLPDMVTPYPPEKFPLARAIRGEALDGVEVFVGDSRARTGRWLSVNATPLKDEEGVLHNGVAVFHDITSRKRAEETLLRSKDAAEAANRAKSQFLANMSHELRTPLNAIIGYSEMLQQHAEDIEQPESIPDLQKIHSAGKHLQALIDDILDLSKIEAGKMDLFVEPFDVAGLVQDVVTTIKPLVEKNRNTLHVMCSDDVGFMRADMTKVRQVLFNLLSNACKFTDRGNVTLDVSRQTMSGADWMHLRVTDTGIGMSAQQMEKLFQDFTQVDASTTRRYGGTGLGLAISQRFCRMMGGDITVESVEGKGSTFTARIPAKVDAPVSEERIVSTHASGSRPGSQGAASDDTVLVIDDDPVVRDLMGRLLTKEGFRVVTASNGEEGLRLAKAVRPGAITLDVMMPDMDGWAVLSAIKSDPEVAEIPVVLVTMTDDRNMGYALGASEYVTKPIDPPRLVNVLKKHTNVGQRPSVLIVDDDPVMREMTARLLTTAGWGVTEAGDGRAALQRLAEHTPSVIVLDLLMPELDGLTFIVELRRRREWRDIPVVVVTAKDVTDDDRSRLNGSVKTILRKGAYQRNELLLAVREQVKACLQLAATSS